VRGLGRHRDVKGITLRQPLIKIVGSFQLITESNESMKGEIDEISPGLEID